MILTQVLLGAGLGYWIATVQQQPLWLVSAIALLLPFAVMILVDTVSALISRESKEPAAMWWRSLVGEFHAGILIFLFRQPWSQTPPVLLPATGAEVRIPVVLVHGYLCNHRIWDDMADALRAKGHAVFAVNLEPLFTSIDRYAPVVDAAVQALIQHSGQRQVALVGHSMGGLAIRAWMRVHGTSRVARVLTLGTPHAGTTLAKGSYPTNAKQLLWKSDWLAALSGSESDATRSLIRIALTPQDNIVCPQRPQVLAGITPTVFEGLGHVQMCIDPTVMDWVCQQVGELRTV
jgi:triacylglycerol esterase/lipase EstA (alpha/beta hydrolase family)